MLGGECSCGRADASAITRNIIARAVLGTSMRRPKNVLRRRRRRSTGRFASRPSLSDVRIRQRNRSTARIMETCDDQHRMPLIDQDALLAIRQNHWVLDCIRMSLRRQSGGEERYVGGGAIRQTLNGQLEFVLYDTKAEVSLQE